jgi:ABC-2 type transport system permease protein
MTAPSTRTPTGSIYDLGYRGYEGPRLGRRHAIAALFNHTVLSCYGIGRGGRAKIVPFILAGIAVLPAVVGVGLIALARQAGAAGDAITELSPFRYESYFDSIAQIVALFCAAQAPELLGRDQRYSVLSLYFSRALERTDYALAKLGGFIVALLVLVLVPQAVIFVGLTLSSADIVEGLAENLPEVLPIVTQGVLLAALFGSLSLAIAAFTPRRAYATAAIIAAFIIPPIVSEIAREATSRDVARWFVLASPPDVISATNAYVFDIRPDSATLVAARHPGELYVAIALVAAAICTLILLRRYQRIAA